MKTMDEYERELEALEPLELMWRLEELTQALATNTAGLGDYHRQMLCKRVMLRKMSPVFMFIDGALRETTLR